MPRPVHPNSTDVDATPARAAVGKLDARVFASDGKAVIVALDHALASGQLAPLDRPVPLLSRVVAGNPDGLILTAGMGRLPDAARVPWFLTADYYATSVFPGAVGEDDLHVMAWDVGGARDFGATGVKCLLVFGRSDPRQLERNVASVARLTTEAHRAGLSVMIEATLWGPRIGSARQHDATMVAHAARVAFELGADVIKIPLPDDLDALGRLAEALPVPIVVMGGPAGRPERLFLEVEQAMAAGVRGVALGRNVWQAPDPAAYVGALRALVHDGVSAPEALERLRAV